MINMHAWFIEFTDDQEQFMCLTREDLIWKIRDKKRETVWAKTTVCLKHLRDFKEEVTGDEKQIYNSISLQFCFKLPPWVRREMRSGPENKDAGFLLKHDFMIK